MAVIQSQIDVHGQDFAANQAAMLATISEFRALEQAVLDKAQAAQEKFHKKGKLYHVSGCHYCLILGRALSS